jgi:hypothetical protein
MFQEGKEILPSFVQAERTAGKLLNGLTKFLLKTSEM